MALKRRIYQQGNSLVVSLPLWMLEEIKVQKGDVVKISVVNKKKIIIERFTDKAHGGNDDGTT